MQSGKIVFDFIGKYSYNDSQHKIFTIFVYNELGVKMYDAGNKKLCKIPSRC